MNPNFCQKVCTLKRDAYLRLLYIILAPTIRMSIIAMLCRDNLFKYNVRGAFSGDTHVDGFSLTLLSMCRI